MHIYILPQCSTTAARVLNSAGMDAQFERLRCAIWGGILKSQTETVNLRQNLLIFLTYSPIIRLLLAAHHGEVSKVPSSVLFTLLHPEIVPARG